MVSNAYTRCSFLTFVLAVSATIASTKVAAGPFSEELTELLMAGSGISPLVVPSYALDRKALPLDLPLFAPNHLTENDDFKSQLSKLDNVPEISDKFARLGSKSIPTALKEAAKSIVLSHPTPSAEEKASIGAATELLYNSDGSPSVKYERYLKYKVDYEDLLLKANKETSTGELQVLRLQLAQLMREWDTLGNRPEIELALSTIVATDGTTNQSALEAWSTQIAPTDFPSIISNSLADNSWVRISYSEENILPLLSIETAQGRKSVSPARISFDGTIIWFNRVYLSEAFFLDRGWKLKDSTSISGGAENSGENSIVPSIVGGILVVKNVEVQYLLESDMQSDQQNAAIVIDGVKLPSESIVASFQRNSVTVPGPIVVGAVIDHLKKIPDPDLNRKWND